MYPRISDLINDLFGTDLLLPAKTFGFFLAISFLLAYFVLKSELVRREKLGHFRLHPGKIKLQGPIPFRDVIFQALTWGVVLYKIGYYLVDAEEFNRYTEDVLLSTKGFWLTGILGLLIGGGWKYWEYAKKKNLEEKYESVMAGPSHYIGVIITIAFVAGIGGAKLFAMLEPDSHFWYDPLGELFSFNGLSFYGGLIVAGVLICWYLVRKGFGVLISLDAFAPSLILAYAVGRIGCQMAGDGDWGIINEMAKPEIMGFLPDWMWSFTYPHNVAFQYASPAVDCIQGVCNAAVQIPGCEGEFCTELARPVYPTPFYETLMGLAIFGILWGLRKVVKYPGQIAGMYLFFNGLERFSIEKIRVNEVFTLFGLELTQAEIISTCLMVAGVAVFFYALYRKKPMVLPPLAA